MTQIPVSTLNGGNVSIPTRHRVPPRPLTEVQLETLLAVADVLIPASGPNPAASSAPSYREWLDLAIAARTADFDTLLSIVASFEGLVGDPQNIDIALRRLNAEFPDRFYLMTAVLSAAYYMIPEIRTIMKVPPLEPSPIGETEAADDLSDGILEVVRKRGPIFTPTADSPRQPSLG